MVARNEPLIPREPPANDNGKALVYLEDANDNGRVAVLLRPMVPEDRPYVFSHWLESYARHVKLNHKVYQEHHPKLAGRLVHYGKTVVACSPETERTLLGFCTTGVDPKCLHYVYVPFELRRHGLARLMMIVGLGGYPERIETSHRWPWPAGESRFQYVPYHAGLCP